MSVNQVSDAEFDAQLAAHPKAVVKYYADWCGSCKLFAPKYKRLATDERFNDVAFLDVNAEKNPQARKAAGVANLPFFAIFREGQLVEAISTSKEEAVVDLLSKLK